MKGFHRTNMLFSLCGLNCGLCPMHLGEYCPGCGGGSGNQGCAIARCSLSHGAPEYCSQCAAFPCDRYDHIDAFDSFITHRNQKRDLTKAQEIGIDAYNAEQAEKVEILRILLSQYNDGRRKTLFCGAVNLLELDELKETLRRLTDITEADKLPIKEKAAHAARLLQETAAACSIDLKLRKKNTQQE